MSGEQDLIKRAEARKRRIAGYADAKVRELGVLDGEGVEFALYVSLYCALAVEQSTKDHPGFVKERLPDVIKLLNALCTSFALVAEGGDRDDDLVRRTRVDPRRPPLGDAPV